MLYGPTTTVMVLLWLVWPEVAVTVMVYEPFGVPTSIFGLPPHPAQIRSSASPNDAHPALRMRGRGERTNMKSGSTSIVRPTRAASAGGADPTLIPSQGIVAAARLTGAVV